MSIIAQSAFAQSPAAAGLDLSAEIIICSPIDGIAEYQGTRTALEAEGIIPEGTVWPNGFDRLYWSDDKFSVELSAGCPPVCALTWALTTPSPAMANKSITPCQH